MPLNKETKPNERDIEPMVLGDCSCLLTLGIPAV